MHICYKHGFHIFTNSGISRLTGVKKQGENFSFLLTQDLFPIIFFLGPFSQHFHFLTLLQRVYSPPNLIISVMSLLHIFEHTLLWISTWSNWNTQPGVFALFRKAEFPWKASHVLVLAVQLSSCLKRVTSPLQASVSLSGKWGGWGSRQASDYWSTWAFVFCFLFLSFFIYLEREKILSRLPAVSAEPNMRINTTDRKIMTWAGVKCWMPHQVSHPDALWSMWASVVALLHWATHSFKPHFWSSSGNLLNPPP